MSHGKKQLLLSDALICVITAEPGLGHRALGKGLRVVSSAVNRCRCLSISAHAKMNFSLQRYQMQSDVSYSK